MRFKKIALLIILLFVFTNYIHIAPFKPFEKLALDNIEYESDMYLFIRDNLKARYFIFDYIYELTHKYNSPDEKIINYLNKHADEDDIFYTNTGNIHIIFYTNLIDYKNYLNKKPDWIIPRESNADLVDLKKMITSDYEEIIINSTDYFYPLDTPHPRVHRFKENKEMKTSRIYPYETYPIKIYKLR